MNRDNGMFRWGKISRFVVVAVLVNVIIIGGFEYGWRSVYANQINFQVGTGTEENTYQVATAEQLDQVRNNLDKHYIQVADIDMAAYVSETGPSYNDGKGWLPIGRMGNSNAFTGTYDGNGYTIANLLIQRENQDEIGLFGYLGTSTKRARVFRVGLENVSITGVNFVGGLVGVAYNSEIRESYVTGNVTGSGLRIGGLIGDNRRLVENCYSSASVVGSAMVGGLVGANLEGSARVVDCYAKGAVTRMGTVGAVGGLIGYQDVNHPNGWENSFYDKNGSGQNDIGKGFGKTAVEMTLMETYIGWGLALSLDGEVGGNISKWGIDDEINEGYPFLRVFHKDLTPPPISSSNAFLGDLEVNITDDENASVSFEPEFSEEVYAYAITVTESVYELRIRAIAEDDKATVKVNSISIGSGGISQPISLETVETVVTIQVVAEDEVTTREYVITITRMAEEQNESQAPEEPTPEEPAPEEPTPEEQTPEELTPEEPTPEEQTPEEPTTEETTPEEPTPEEPTPVEPTPEENQSDQSNQSNQNYSQIDSDLNTEYVIKFDEESQTIRLFIDESQVASFTQGDRVVIDLDGLGILDTFSQYDTGVSINISIPSAPKILVTFSWSGAIVMAEKDILLQIGNSTASYHFPVRELFDGNWESEEGLEEVASISIEVNDASESILEIAPDVQLINPTEFRVYKEVNIPGVGSIVEITHFTTYVVRDLVLPDEWTPEKLGTGVIIEEIGVINHVPTSFYQLNGTWYAQMKSMSNSMYGLLAKGNVDFLDIQGHWAQKHVESLAFRNILQGDSVEGYRYYYPNKMVSRAEFAAIIMRALGLGNTDVREDGLFDDVHKEDWFNKYLTIARLNNIVSGYGDQTFRPHESITRQQAAVLVYNTMKFITAKTRNDRIVEQMNSSSLAKLYVDDNVAYVGSELFNDWDQVNPWAMEAILSCINSHIFTGHQEMLRPEHFLTRAEAAVLIERLLLQSGLISRQ